MEPIFYDKEGSRIDKELQSVNKEANNLQATVPIDRQHLSQAVNAFTAHDKKIDERIVALSKEQVKGGDFRTAVGIMVSFLLAWEVFHVSRGAFTWLSRKMRRDPQTGVQDQRTARRHARDWRENKVGGSLYAF
jgi:hypothetical protein